VGQGADSDFIVQVKTTPGNVSDAAVLPELAQPQARELTGNKAHDSQTKCVHLAALVIAPGLQSRYPRPGRPRHSWLERPKIERKFAECKKFHCFRQTRYWRSDRVAIQTIMVALVVNLKRWVTLLRLRSPAFFWAHAA